MGKVQFRFRCPCCGMVSWENPLLNKQFAFEVMTQERMPKGVARKSMWKWDKNLNQSHDYFVEFKKRLALKLRRILGELEGLVPGQIFRDGIKKIKGCHCGFCQPGPMNVAGHPEWWERKYTVVE